MPRPTRRLACLAPEAGLMVLSSMFLTSCPSAPLQHQDEIGDLVDHAADRGGVLEHGFAVQAAQAQATHRVTVRLLGADRAAHQLDPQGLLLFSHVQSFAPADQPKISSTVLPRL